MHADSVRAPNPLPVEVSSRHDLLRILGPGTVQGKDSDDEDSESQPDEDEGPSTSGNGPRAMQLDAPQHTNFAERAK